MEVDSQNLFIVLSFLDGSQQVVQSVCGKFFSQELVQWTGLVSFYDITFQLEYENRSGAELEDATMPARLMIPRITNRVVVAISPSMVASMYFKKSFIVLKF